MNIKKELGNKIKHLRIMNGYTQDKLSELLNISQRALSSIELGKNFITSDTLEKILEVFNIELEELFATNSHKEPDELVKLINKNILKLNNDSYKLEIIYNLTKSLIR